MMKMFQALRPGRGTTLFVAASNANRLSKWMADYICDGTADEVEINLALAAISASGGKVSLSEGMFTIAAPITYGGSNRTLEGQGFSTIIKVVNAGGAPINDSLVLLNGSNNILRNLKIDGNKANNAGATIMTGADISGDECLVEKVWALNVKSWGFFVASGVSGSAVTDCIAEGCDSIGFMMRSTATGITRCNGNWAKSCGFGFCTDTGFVSFNLCVAQTSAAVGFSFTGGSDVLASGCIAEGNGTVGFSTGIPRTHFSGCMARNNGTGGFALNGAFSSAQSCYSYLNAGAGGASAGFDINSPDCQLVGCVSLQNGTHGVRCVGDRSQIVSSRFMDNGTQAATTYQGIVIAANDCFMQGNVIRKGSAAANKQLYGIQIAAGGNNYIGANDLYDSGTAGEISDSGSTTRRLVKLALDFALAANTTVASITVNTWTDFLANQTFRVDSATSVVEIAASGVINAQGAAGSSIATRLVIDSAGTPINKKLGGEWVDQASQPKNALAGAQPVKLTGLAIGNHTVKIQVRSTVSYSFTTNAVAAPETDFLNIQVTEFQR